MLKWSSKLFPHKLHGDKLLEPVANTAGMACSLPRLCLSEPAAQGLFNDSLISHPVMPLNDTGAALVVMTSPPTTA